MNSAFSEYVRSAAFRLDLSARQIQALLDVAGVSEDPNNLCISPYRALERRGLIFWAHPASKPKHGPYLTEAGELVVNLLRVAGYIEGKDPDAEGVAA